MREREFSSDVLIVGAGIAGSMCAHVLQQSGARVRLLDKGKGPGGRMSTRRSDAGRFDHGAQYFTVRDERFRGYVDEWIDRGAVQTWDGRFATIDGEGVQTDSGRSARFVGVPGMNAPVRELQAGLDVRFAVRVTGLERAGGSWSVTIDDGAVERARAVVVTAPAPQAVALLDGVSPFAQAFGAVRVDPCWATMVTFANPVPVDLDGIRFEAGELSWAARDSSKPGRPGGERWVLHSAPAWAETVLEDPPDAIARRMLTSLSEAMSVKLPVATHLAAHRWLYAKVRHPLGANFLWDADTALGVAGDACRGARVEDAALSGLELAQEILAR